ncbi:hornerin-like [Pyrgilauda ruficollis]|uniref:hornerin-like n=1 Tax=Pyrgilauda ruficollis TaxID=221976 RepID=UPI001B85D31F|nr:hornerin-like [Pyrgilauda ruficollis]
MGSGQRAASAGSVGGHRQPRSLPAPLTPAGREQAVGRQGADREWGAGSGQCQRAVSEGTGSPAGREQAGSRQGMGSGQRAVPAGSVGGHRQPRGQGAGREQTGNGERAAGSASGQCRRAPAAPRAGSRQGADREWGAGSGQCQRAVSEGSVGGHRQPRSLPAPLTPAHGQWARALHLPSPARPMAARPRRCALPGQWEPALALVNDAAVQGRLSHVSWPPASMETPREQAGVEASGRHSSTCPQCF